MAGRLIEIKGSGDFTRGPTSVEGKGLAIVLDAESQNEAEALALAYFPPVVAGVLRGSAQVTDQGGDVYLVEVQYRNAVPTENSPTAGDSPSGQRPAGGGKGNNDPLTRDMTFSTGGATKKRQVSINTRHKLTANPLVEAPDFGGLIGVTKDGKVEGCDVIAPMADFTITKRFASLSFGWFRHMLDTIAHTNETDWLGMEAGEVLFKGCDGNYKDGDQFPWTVTGKFSYSRNYVRGESAEIDDMLTVGGVIEIPDIGGWEHLWVSYLPKEIATTWGFKYKIDFPRWVYVEQIYLPGDFSALGLDV